MLRQAEAWPPKRILIVCAAIAIAALVVAIVAGGEPDSSPGERRAAAVAELRSEVERERELIAELRRGIGPMSGGPSPAFRARGGLCRLELVLSGEELALYGETSKTIIAPDRSAAIEVSSLSSRGVECRRAARRALGW